MISDTFETLLLQAVVRQFFENPPMFGTTLDGQPINIPARATPAQEVAARLLNAKNAELLDAIVEAIDLDVLAGQVASQVLATLKLPERTYGGYDSSPTAKIRERLKERVDNRLVELMAQDIHARMKADEAAAAGEAASD